MQREPYSVEPGDGAAVEQQLRGLAQQSDAYKGWGSMVEDGWPQQGAKPAGLARHRLLVGGAMGTLLHAAPGEITGQQQRPIEAMAAGPSVEPSPQQQRPLKSRAVGPAAAAIGTFFSPMGKLLSPHRKQQQQQEESGDGESSSGESCREDVATEQPTTLLGRVAALLSPKPRKGCKPSAQQREARLRFHMDAVAQWHNSPAAARVWGAGTEAIAHQLQLPVAYRAYASMPGEPQSHWAFLNMVQQGRGPLPHTAIDQLRAVLTQPLLDGVPAIASDSALITEADSKDSMLHCHGLVRTDHVVLEALARTWRLPGPGHALER
jgi:hypothetical protein